MIIAIFKINTMSLYFYISFGNGPGEFAQALQSMDRRQIRHDGRFQRPPPLLALERHHLFFTQLAHELRLCHAPHLKFMEIKEGQHGKCVVVIGFQMLPSAVIFSGPMPGAFDFTFVAFKHAIMLAGGSWRQLEQFGQDQFADGAKRFGVQAH